MRQRDDPADSISSGERTFFYSARRSVSRSSSLRLFVCLHFKSLLVNQVLLALPLRFSTRRIFAEFVMLEGDVIRKADRAAELRLLRRGSVNVERVETDIVNDAHC